MITPFFSSFCSFLKSKGNNASVCEREMSACTWRKRMIDKQCNRFGVTEFLDEVRWMILDLFEMIYNNYFSSGRFAPKYEQQQKRMAAISEHRGESSPYMHVSPRHTHATHYIPVSIIVSRDISQTLDVVFNQSCLYRKPAGGRGKGGCSRGHRLKFSFGTLWALPLLCLVRNDRSNIQTGVSVWVPHPATICLIIFF